MEVVFVVVLGDILIGTAPEYGGLLPEWTGASPAHCFWLRRDVVLGAVSLLVLLPLAAMRSMERLAVVNIIGGSNLTGTLCKVAFAAWHAVSHGELDGAHEPLRRHVACLCTQRPGCAHKLDTAILSIAVVVMAPGMLIVACALPLQVWPPTACLLA